MTRRATLNPRAIVGALLLLAVARGAEAQISVLVDATRDGGIWWSPNNGPYDPSVPHQGKALADHMRAQGMQVTELGGRVTITCEMLSRYQLVLAVSPYAGLLGLPAYSASELAAYTAYVSQGGRLILFSDNKLAGDLDILPQAFGLDFSGAVPITTITSFTAHPITTGVTSLLFISGTFVSAAPPSATMLGFIGGQPVMGVMPFGAGTIFFIGDGNGIENVPQPFVSNLLTYMLSGARLINACSTPTRPRPGDFDGDRKTDVTIFRPSTGQWFVRQSSTFTPMTLVWGGGADKPVPGDYDGDGIADVAVFRPSTGEWFVRQSTTFTLLTLVWGGGGDIPVPADYDGDGKTDVAIFRPSTGQWFIRQSSTFTLQTVVWGGGSDIPVQADYDGDGKTDVAIFRSSTGEWFIRQSSTFTLVTLVWGGGSDTPVAGDYDGDGKADLSVFRASTGEWFVRQSSTFTLVTLVWGGGGDIPVPGDYDGDGKLDVAIFRPSTGEWFVRESNTFTLLTVVWGGGTDIPILKRP